MWKVFRPIGLNGKLVFASYLLFLLGVNFYMSRTYGSYLIHRITGNGLKSVVNILLEATPLILLSRLNYFFGNYRAIGSNHIATTDFNPLNMSSP